MSKAQNYRSSSTNRLSQQMKQPPQQSPSLSNLSKKTIEAYASDYNIGQITRVGQLTGKNIIRNLKQVDMSQFDKYYEQEDNADLQFEPHNLDTKPAQFIDPFSADLFKDEMVDIDFGAIDAFTEALNAQIIAEKNGSEPPKNLRFPSHVIASNHASFLDNQLFIGDSSSNNENSYESSGVNVQFVKPSKSDLNGVSEAA
jgi:hypothetical protein